MSRAVYAVMMGIVSVVATLGAAAMLAFFVVWGIWFTGQIHIQPFWGLLGGFAVFVMFFVAAIVYIFEPK